MPARAPLGSPECIRRRPRAPIIHAGISADQMAARELAKHTQFGSLEIGVEAPSLAGGCDSGYSCAYTNTISWSSPTTPNPMEVNPRVLFERLFGDGDSTDSASRMEWMQAARQHARFRQGQRGPAGNQSSGQGDRQQAHRIPGRDSRYRAPHSESGRAEREHDTNAGDRSSRLPRRRSSWTTRG